MTNKRKTLLSGVKPTGKPHIGNYFGAMKQFVDLQGDYGRTLIFIADYHALNNVQNREEMNNNIYEIALDYLAIGLDPKNVTIFKQSDIPQHSELAVILNSITTMSYLMRAHAYKDAQARNKEISVGTFDYPMLMAADILMYDADVVPVGQDQKQHIEITRDIAEKFNRIFGETFKIPEPLILENVATVPGTDGKKMSKSYNNTIGLFAEDEEIEKAVMSIVTDSKAPGDTKDPEKDNIFALHKLFSKEQLSDLEKRYKEGGISYKESKEILIENIKKIIKPLREKRKELEKDKEYVLDILREGGDEMRARAEKKMQEVRDKIGTKLYE
ncbi:MAG: tryptophan--tRNA ligase [Candidatus Pacebacteria bacterium]|jgi:tryptophanyl-tRNA synthetase|nr:tryptophan--tRNA ligase [Parcubacteria group bacterium]MDP6249618.1 tryptophan--tRNA ligase [Candidatus Paceibacterota bacterium]MDP7159286.1 tryptophan--tRNA ligase [Candidatus Paceibacterota bacterium]MDP7368826.1 tryptophan--tRNA ligase [Candidatus Paceibacterota bacterium]MDP7466046.1 tryptophan--tRNA ligase [Candidatus Paceibacterota bacterium]|tara:strand:+ start:825 stop:1811 length:987 start_codon:yes stop_codon:yes gene_type:complete